MSKINPTIVLGLFFLAFGAFTIMKRNGVFDRDAAVSQKQSTEPPAPVATERKAARRKPASQSVTDKSADRAGRILEFYNRRNGTTKKPKRRPKVNQSPFEGVVRKKKKATPTPKLQRSAIYVSSWFGLAGRRRVRIVEFDRKGKFVSAQMEVPAGFTESPSRPTVSEFKRLIAVNAKPRTSTGTYTVSRTGVITTTANTTSPATLLLWKDGRMTITSDGALSTGEKGLLHPSSFRVMR